MSAVVRVLGRAAVRPHVGRHSRCQRQPPLGRSLKALEWTCVEKGLQQLGETPLYVLRRRYQTAEVRDAKLRLEARNQRPVLLLVDFVQMLQDQGGDGRTTSTNMAEATKRLKLIAKNFAVPRWLPPAANSRHGRPTGRPATCQSDARSIERRM